MPGNVGRKKGVSHIKKFGLNLYRNEWKVLELYAPNAISRQKYAVLLISEYLRDLPKLEVVTLNPLQKAMDQLALTICLDLNLYAQLQLQATLNHRTPSQMAAWICRVAAIKTYNRFRPNL